MRAPASWLAFLTACAAAPSPASLPSAPPVEVAAAAAAMPVAPRADLAFLDTFIPESLAAWNTPGLAVAAVHDGKVVYSRGFGYRDRERKLPVTTKTLFGIGSITKSMTAAALGTLVDEHKLDWDAPVVRYLPSFALYDGYATEHATVRDLASHKTGVPDHWFLWFGADRMTREDLLGRLRYLAPNHELRQTYEYNTLMFVALGEMGARGWGEERRGVHRRASMETTRNDPERLQHLRDAEERRLCTDVREA